MLPAAHSYPHSVLLSASDRLLWLPDDTRIALRG